MTHFSAHEPSCAEHPDVGIALVIRGPAKDLGGFMVRRALPSPKRRSLGSFVFVDHMGPATFDAGAGISVRPHPHIGLATVTYLFDGEIRHRDSLGSDGVIQPGAINWMTAGRGIVHSERMTERGMREGGSLHGLQLWVALPAEHEEAAPAFRHYPASDLPRFDEGGARVSLLVGEAWGRRSPVATFSPILFAVADLETDATLAMPEAEELGVYVVEGNVAFGSAQVEGPALVVLDGAQSLTAIGKAKVALLGGAPLDGPRHMWWNFVSSRRERIEEAKRAWRERRFDEVPGDPEWIPLPE
ncbi:MAG: pirin family protein [Polyangiaceae bacterium]